MFGFFRKQPTRPAPASEPVYLTAPARADALAAACGAAQRRGERLVLVSPFRGHLAELRDQLQSRGLLVELVDPSYRDAAPLPDSIPLVDQATFVRLASRLSDGQPLQLFQVERHPLREHDEAVEDALGALGKGSALHVFLSLEDGLFRLFGGALQELGQKLGMAEGEAIEHPMVTSSIANAQTKIRKRVSEEKSADTFDAWRALNLGN